jgi:O-antigen/teichoic acid export membrane protein
MAEQPEMAESAGIAGRSIHSATWLFAHKAVANAVRLVAVAVLARQLEPAQFGVVALAAVVLQFATLVGEAGVGTYVVYDRADGRESRAQAAFWLNVAITTVQCAVCLALIPVITRIYPEPGLAPVLGALTAVFFVNQLAMVPDALLRRDLRHPVLARRDMAIDVGSATLSVALALAGAGVWSLVVPVLVAQPISVAVALRAARWRPRLPFHVREWRTILRYTAPLMGSNALGLVANDGDTLLVGRVLGAGPLGYYSMAWQLANLVGRNVTSVVASVTMPALALVRDDLARFRAAYLRMVALLGLVCLPLLTGMFVMAGDLVPALYGSRWAPTIALLRIFVVFTLVRSLTSPSSMVYNVTGRPDIGFKFTIAFTPVYLAAIVVGSRWGAVGVASAVMIVRVVGAVVDLRLATGQMGMPVRAVASVLRRAVLLAVAAATAAWLAREALVQAGVGLFPRLALASAAGGAVYVAAVVRLRPPGYDDLARVAQSLVRAVGSRRRTTPAAPIEQPTVATSEPR